MPNFLQLLWGVKKTLSKACILRTGGACEGLPWSGQTGSGSKLDGQDQLLFGVEPWVDKYSFRCYCYSKLDVCGVGGQAELMGAVSPGLADVCSKDCDRPGGWVRLWSGSGEASR